MTYNILSPPKQFHLPHHYRANGGLTSTGHYFFALSLVENSTVDTTTKQLLKQYTIQRKFVSYHKVYIQS